MADRTISETIRTLAGVNGTNVLYLYDAEVNTVDQDNRICNCTVVSGETAWDLDVRLMASLDDGILILPTVGSNVVISGSDHCDFYVSQFSEIDKIILQGGDLGGLVKLLPLIADLNKIQKDINTLKDAFSNWVVTPNDGGAALKAVSANWFGQQLDLSIPENLENTNITQG